MHATRQTQETYAITVVAHQRQRHFQRTANADLFIEMLFRYRDQGRFAVHGFVVMPDHIHVLITPAMNVSTARAVQFIKGGYSFAVRKQSPGEVWQSGYHEHRIRDLDDFENQRIYIAKNPVRKKYADYPHVHTVFEDRLDPTPEHLMVGPKKHTPGAEAPSGRDSGSQG
ncbi:putative transposase [Granulicella rosea]|uniref:Putative transposase n=1 Tax=Granulicella rosea TaxID=474952 RepID=A0A239D7S6_9BACT|nr:transposase [Granulicella rosea]SNS27901.1 putative transposase [Granulicella rosea]